MYVRGCKCVPKEENITWIQEYQAHWDEIEGINQPSEQTFSFWDFIDLIA